ncbi:MAG: hypothetical protein Q4C70_05470 [Planctomycetia bacterium]|nr:hypothetical protein [Planctomycetia bacterium]
MRRLMEEMEKTYQAMVKSGMWKSAETITSSNKSPPSITDPVRDYFQKLETNGRIKPIDAGSVNPLQFRAGTPSPRDPWHGTTAQQIGKDVLRAVNATMVENYGIGDYDSNRKFRNRVRGVNPTADKVLDGSTNLLTGVGAYEIGKLGWSGLKRTLPKIVSTVGKGVSVPMTALTTVFTPTEMGNSDYYRTEYGIGPYVPARFNRDYERAIWETIKGAQQTSGWSDEQTFNLYQKALQDHEYQLERFKNENARRGMNMRMQAKQKPIIPASYPIYNQRRTF